jgi:hypothetical protein
VTWLLLDDEPSYPLLDDDPVLAKLLRPDELLLPE